MRAGRRRAGFPDPELEFGSLTMDRLGVPSRQVAIGDVPVTGFASPFAGERFAAMIVAFRSASVAEKERLARSLIHEGCRYAVCAGVDCDEWEAAFDDVDVEENPDGEASRFVMTTCHKGESLDEVAEFRLTCTAIEEKVSERFFVLSVGGEGADREAVKETVARILAALPNTPLQRT